MAHPEDKAEHERLERDARPEIFYREVNARWSNDVLAISVEEFTVVRRTPKGCWIVNSYWFGHRDYPKHLEKFILNDAGKKYAYPTREEARASFIRRKQAEIAHCVKQHDRAVRYLALANTGKYVTRNEALHEIKPADILLLEVPAPSVN